MSNETKDIKDVIAPKEAVKSQSLAQMDLEIKQIELDAKRAELEAKRLEILERTANVQDLQERLDERQLKRDAKGNEARSHGNVLVSNRSSENAQQKRCNHRKGGNGGEGLISGKGDDDQYAILKHQFCNGDWWVRCLRCGKTWKPPLRDEYENDAQFEKAVALYELALEFNTRNSASGSIMFKFSDGGEHYRREVRNVTLR